MTGWPFKRGAHVFRLFSLGHRASKVSQFCCSPGARRKCRQDLHKASEALIQAGKASEYLEVLGVKYSIGFLLFEGFQVIGFLKIPVQFFIGNIPNISIQSIHIDIEKSIAVSEALKWNQAETRFAGLAYLIHRHPTWLVGRERTKAFHTNRPCRAHVWTHEHGWTCFMFPIHYEFLHAKICNNSAHFQKLSVKHGM